MPLLLLLLLSKHIATILLQQSRSSPLWAANHAGVGGVPEERRRSLPLLRVPGHHLGVVCAVDTPSASTARAGPGQLLGSSLFFVRLLGHYVLARLQWVAKAHANRDVPNGCPVEFGAGARLRQERRGDWGGNRAERKELYQQLVWCRWWFGAFPGACDATHFSIQGINMLMHMCVQPPNLTFQRGWIGKGQ